MENFLSFCCHSCLKGDDDKEYYKVLEIEYENHPSTEDVKRAYKKASLNLHPDKLAQRGIEVTAEHKQQFLKASKYQKRIKHIFLMIFHIGQRSVRCTL